MRGDASLHFESESEMRVGMAGMGRVSGPSLSDVSESEQRPGMPERSGWNAEGAGGGVMLLKVSARRFACRCVTGVEVEAGLETGVEVEG